MGIFGWSLPPGCGELPGEAEEVMDNEYIKTAFADHEGPYDLYRATYKYTPCGPSVGFLISDTCSDGKADTRWYYCDESRKLGTWAEMDAKGLLVLAVSVSSIVEGVDYGTGELVLDCSYEALLDVATEEEQDSLDKTIRRVFYQMVEETDQEANSIWHDTHGCPSCAEHWLKADGEIEGPWLGFDDERWESGATSVWIDCPDCGGEGIVI